MAEEKAIDLAELRAAAAKGTAKAHIDIGATRLDFTFRKPTAREWRDYDAARSAYSIALTTGNLTTALSKEMFEKSEELCVRVVTSHSPEQLQALEDEHLGIFFPLAFAIGDSVDVLRAGAGKASPPPGGG